MPSWKGPKAKVRQVCERCQGEFWSQRSARFCSRTCQSRNYDEKQRKTDRTRPLTCEFCKVSFFPKFKASRFCSRKCQISAYPKNFPSVRIEAQRKRRQKALSQGKCVYNCGRDAMPNKVYCQPCRRHHSLLAHKREGYQRYYLGALSNPSRTEWILKNVKIENPFLAKDWKEVEPFIRQNIDLWAEKQDYVLHQYFSLENIHEMPGLEKEVHAYYARNNDVSLEDYVISEIDKQRERWAAMI